MRDLDRRVTALEQRQQHAHMVFLVHGAAAPDGGCPDCPLPAEAHFTISIDRAEGREDDVR